MKTKKFIVLIFFSGIMGSFIGDSMRSNSNVCAGDISLNPTGSYILIYKSSSQSDRYPEGFLLYTTLIKDEEGDYIKNEKLANKIEIIGPNGEVFKTINNSSFDPVTSEVSGYEIFTIHGYKRWKGYDLAYNRNNLPTGDYSIKVTSISSIEKSNTMTFRGGRDPIKGYPTAIKYDAKTRKVTWNGTTGQAGYRVILFKGDKGTSLEYHNMVYFSGFKKGDLVKGTSFVLPQEVVLESGKPYFIIVAAHDSEDNTSEKMNYLHFQDDKDEIATFTAP